MPLSAVELCAAALVKIGARPFAAFEDDTAEAACARRLYPIARDLLLSLHPWSFTLAQARLTARAASRRSPTSRTPSRCRPTICARSRSAPPAAAGAWPIASRAAASCAMREEIVLNYQRRVARGASCRPSSCRCW